MRFFKLNKRTPAHMEIKLFLSGSTKKGSWIMSDAIVSVLSAGLSHLWLPEALTLTRHGGPDNETLTMWIYGHKGSTVFGVGLVVRTQSRAKAPFWHVLEVSSPVAKTLTRFHCHSYNTHHFTLRLHVYGLTFIPAGGGDGGGVIAEKIGKFSSEFQHLLNNKCDVTVYF